VADGLLHFLYDFYENVKKNKLRLSKEMVSFTVRIKELLMVMSDDVHKILEAHRQFMRKDID
jgi:hypothetical protein